MGTGQAETTVMAMTAAALLQHDMPGTALGAPRECFHSTQRPSGGRDHYLWPQRTGEEVWPEGANTFLKVAQLRKSWTWVLTQASLTSQPTPPAASASQ